MGIDIVVAIFLVIFFIKGYSQGLIMSLFSISSYLVGFFAAMHFSFVIANLLTDSFKIPEQWIPIIAFILLFIAVIFIVKWLGKFVEKMMGKLLPTVFNKFAGAILWVLIGFVMLSLFYQLINSAQLFTDEVKTTSQTAPYLENVSDVIKNKIGEVLPFLKGLYNNIDEYFKELAQQVKA